MKKIEIELDEDLYYQLLDLMAYYNVKTLSDLLKILVCMFEVPREENPLKRPKQAKLRGIS